MLYSFEINWPYPFKPGWLTSKQRFATIEQAAKAASEWMIVSLENDCVMEVRLIKIEDKQP